MKTYTITTENGTRTWAADDEDHAREQHQNGFPDEPILKTKLDEVVKVTVTLYDATTEDLVADLERLGYQTGEVESA